jgi:transcriptional repressor NrdR
VVKQNGKREDFSRNKLHQSFSRALHKRPVPVEYIEQAIERIIQKVLAYGEKEITARALGENVMHELKKMDKVAYIRFASVYRSFSDVEDFHDVIRDLD